tara:strand:+ start:479 stop:745 length:267 start_codon:yes stop_codon:yes gene_type:complete
MAEPARVLFAQMDANGTPFAFCAAFAFSVVFTITAWITLTAIVSLFAVRAFGPAIVDSGCSFLLFGGACQQRRHRKVAFERETTLLRV